MSLNQLLDEAKLITGSDRQTALHLNITPSFLSRIRAGKAPMPTAKAFRLADILKRPHLQVVCEVEADQVKDPKDRDMYLRLKSGLMAASLVLLLATPLLASEQINGGVDYLSTQDGMSYKEHDSLFIAHIAFLMMLVRQWIASRQPLRGARFGKDESLLGRNNPIKPDCSIDLPLALRP